MSTPIIDLTPTWAAAKTVVGAQPPSSADMLDILRSHGNRAAHLWRRLLRQRHPLAASGTALLTNVHTIVEHPNSGTLIVIGDNGGTGKYQRLDAASLLVTAAGTLDIPGLYAMANSVAASNGSDKVVCMNGGSYIQAWVTNAAGVFSSATWPSSFVKYAQIAYCASSGLFVALGQGSSDEATIETTPDASTWTPRSTNSDQVNAQRFLSTDGDNQAIVIQNYLGSGTPTCGYSDDGGVTWAWTRQFAPGSEVYLRGAAYDDARGLWIAPSYSPSDRVFASSTPDVADSWSELATLPETIQRLYSQAGVWVTDTGMISFDAGATWSALGATEGSLDFVLIPGDGRFWETDTDALTG